jgi:galactose mutarotase-like enzyme
VQLEGSSVRLEYEVTNLSRTSVKFLWSAHPLLNVQPKAEIVLPPEGSALEVSWSKDERLGHPGSRCAWPLTKESSGRIVDLSKVLLTTGGTADKLFTSPLSQGLCGMFVPEVNESIAFRFDPEMIPYVGIWISEGGWPPSRSVKQFTVALEPCTGRPDSLEQAIQREECSTVEGRSSKRWWLQIDLGSGALEGLLNQG